MQLGGVKLDLGQGEDPDLQAGHQGGPHRAGALGVPRLASCSAARCATCMAGSGHIAGVVNPPAKKKYQYWTGRTAELACRVDGDGDRDGGIVVARLGHVARRLFGSESAGARSLGRPVMGNRGRARIVREEPRLARLRKERQLLEAGGLVEAEHQVEILQRLAGRALDQIVEGRDDDGAARQPVGEDADMAIVRAAHMLGRGNDARPRRSARTDCPRRPSSRAARRSSAAPCRPAGHSSVQSSPRLIGMRCGVKLTVTASGGERQISCSISGTWR